MKSSYKESLKKTLLKKPDSIKPKMIRKSVMKSDTLKVKKLKLPISKKRKMVKGKGAADVANRLKRMKAGTLSTSPK
tara:strand:+ start:7936 stop:8166 length:231 start_codon:yes stop_codon:yes gene_type:complete